MSYTDTKGNENTSPLVGEHAFREGDVSKGDAVKGTEMNDSDIEIKTINGIPIAFIEVKNKKNLSEEDALNVMNRMSETGILHE